MGKWKNAMLALEDDVAERLDDYEEPPESVSQSILEMIDRYVAKTEKRFGELGKQHKIELENSEKALRFCGDTFEKDLLAMREERFQLTNTCHEARDAADRANAALADGLAEASDARRELYKLLGNPSEATTLAELVAEVVARGLKARKAIGPGQVWYDESGAIDPKEIIHLDRHVGKVPQLGMGYALPVWGAPATGEDLYASMRRAFGMLTAHRTLNDAIDSATCGNVKVVAHANIFDRIVQWGIGKPGDAKAVRAEMLKRGYSRHVRDDGTSIYVLDATDGLKRRIAEHVLEDLTFAGKVRADFAVDEFARRVPGGRNWWSSKFSYFGLDAAGYDFVPYTACTWRKRDK